MTPLTITSTKQGIAYSETEAVAAFSRLEALVAFAAKLKLLLTARPEKLQRPQPVRSARA